MRRQGQRAMVLLMAAVAATAAAAAGGGLGFGPADETLLNKPVAFFQDVIRSIAAYRGELWVGTYGQGVFVLDSAAMRATPVGAGQVRHLTHATCPLLEDRVNCLEVVGQDLWIGTCGGVNVTDGHAWRAYTTHSAPAGQTVAHDIYHVIRGDPSGAVWVGTTGKGVCRFDGKGWRTWTEAEGLPSGWVNDTALDARGTRWVATARGVALLDGERWHAPPARQRAPDLWSHATALALLDGEMWVGTGAQGLRMWSDGYWYDPTAEAALPAPEVTGMLVDHERRLWIATRAGIVSYRRGEAFRTYGASKGLVDPHVMIVGELGDPPVLWAGSYKGWLYRLDREHDAFVAVCEKGRLVAEAGGAPRSTVVSKERSGL